MYHLATIHNITIRQTDGQSDRQTDDSTMPIANPIGKKYLLLG